jgi:hypothetical protein
MTNECVSLDVIFLLPFVVQDNKLYVVVIKFGTQICSSLRNASRTYLPHVATTFRQLQLSSGLSAGLRPLGAGLNSYICRFQRCESANMGSVTTGVISWRHSTGLLRCAHVGIFAYTISKDVTPSSSTHT